MDKKNFPTTGRTELSDQQLDSVIGGVWTLSGAHIRCPICGGPASLYGDYVNRYYDCKKCGTVTQDGQQVKK